MLMSPVQVTATVAFCAEYVRPTGSLIPNRVKGSVGCHSERCSNLAHPEASVVAFNHDADFPARDRFAAVAIDEFCSDSER